MNKDALLNKIMQTDFALVDLQLFLNTHPNDTAAIAKYNELAAASDDLHAQYEQSYAPLSYGLESKPDYFSWIEGWPWLKENEQ